MTWPWSPRCRCLILTSTGELAEDMAVKPTMSLSISYLHWRAVWWHGREDHDVAVYLLPPLASCRMTWPWSPRCRCLILTSTGELSDDMAVKPTMSLSNSYLHWRAVWGHGREADDVAVYFLPPLASCLMTWPWSPRCRWSRPSRSRTSRVPRACLASAGRPRSCERDSACYVVFPR